MDSGLLHSFVWHDAFTFLWVGLFPYVYRSLFTCTLVSFHIDFGLLHSSVWHSLTLSHLSFDAWLWNFTLRLFCCYVTLDSFQIVNFFWSWKWNAFRETQCDVYMHIRTCVYVKRDLYICKKRPNAMWDPMDDCEYTHWVSFYVYTGLIWNVECVWPWNWNALHGLACYGVATISRLLKIIGLFCRILSLL